MIAKLSGLLDSTGLDWLIIDVGGVGYHVFTSGRTLSQLPPMGQKLSLIIETLVRNEQTQLFGFTQESERDWFRLFLGIQGVGAKVALALLTALTSEELHRAILTQDRESITRADGIGPKLAGRIIAELKDKVGSLALSTTTIAHAHPINLETPPFANTLTEAISALTNLGYRRPEAVEAIVKASQALGSEISTESLLRYGLNLLSPYANNEVAHG